MTKPRDAIGVRPRRVEPSPKAGATNFAWDVNQSRVASGRLPRTTQFNTKSTKSTKFHKAGWNIFVSFVLKIRTV